MKGKVEWPYQKLAAENAIHRLIGVKGVRNDITVTPQVAPSAVKEKIEAALTRNAHVDAKGVRVEAHLPGKKTVMKAAAWIVPAGVLTSTAILPLQPLVQRAMAGLRWVWLYILAIFGFENKEV